jgi:Tfp pilus assembly protein PilV
MNVLLPRSARRRGYSLADTLVAASILAIGVGAAASLTLSMDTQDEIAWRVSRGTALLEAAATLHGMGLAPGTIAAVLPPDAETALSFGTVEAETVAGLELEAVDVTATTRTTDDTGSWTPGSWTGGGGATPVTRTTTVRAYRSLFQVGPHP